MVQRLYDQASAYCESCGNPLERNADVLHWGRLTLLHGSLSCLGRVTHITGQQAVILRALMGRGVVSRDGLLQRLDSMGEGIEPNNVYVNVCRLRKALVRVKAPCVIRSVPCMGYSLEAVEV